MFFGEYAGGSLYIGTTTLINFANNTYHLACYEKRDKSGIIVSFDGGNYNEFEASFLDESGNGPFVHDRRKPGRPVEREGTYQRITLEVRSDLLQKIDDSGKSRREYIEELLLQS